MKIINVTVITEREQDDKVIINTDLPKGIAPFEGVEKGFVVYVSQGSGVRYALENFSCTVIEVFKNGTKKVIRKVD